MIANQGRCDPWHDPDPLGCSIGSWLYLRYRSRMVPTRVWSRVPPDHWQTNTCEIGDRARWPSDTVACDRVIVFAKPPDYLAARCRADVIPW